MSSNVGIQKARVRDLLAVGSIRGLRALMLATSAIVLISATQATAQSNSGSRPLERIDVEGERVSESPESEHSETEDPFGPVDGYIATRGTTASKSDTPLIEIPQSISVITRDRLDVQSADSISEALRYTPGVMGEAFGNDSRVNFLQYRGFSEGGAGVYQDGLQLRSSGFAQFMPELYGAERVEVLRGPASVLYGQGSPGGLVNVITKRPPSDPFGEVELEGGSFDKIEGRFDVGGPVFGSNEVFFRLTGLARDSETQVDFVDDDRMFIAPALTWKPQENTTLTILGNYQDDKTGSTNQFLPAAGTVNSNPNGIIPTNRLTGEPDLDRFDRTNHSFGYLFEHIFNDTLTFRQNLRYDALDSKTDTFFALGFFPGSQRNLVRAPFLVRSNSDIFSVDSQAQVSLDTGPVAHTLLFGVDYQHYDFYERQRTGSLASGTASIIDIFNPSYGTAVNISAIPITLDADISQEQTGVYVQDQLKIRENLIVTLGGRWDFVESVREDRLTASDTKQSNKEFSGRAGVVYLTDIGLAPYFSYAESFQPIIGVNSNGTPFVPETGKQYEVGIKYETANKKSSVTLAAFEITRQNVRNPDPSNPLLQIQTGEVQSRGIEAEATASLDSGLDFITTYTYQDVEITKSTLAGIQGKRPSSVPEHMASLWAFYTFQNGPLTGFGFGSGARYKGTSFGDGLNTFKVNSHALIDAAASYEWQDYRLSINAQNVFDKRHVGSCFGQFGCFYGADQTVTASLGYRW